MPPSWSLASKACSSSFAPDILLVSAASTMYLVVRRGEGRGGVRRGEERRAFNDGVGSGVSNVIVAGLVGL